MQDGTSAQDGTNLQDESPLQDSLPVETETPQEEVKMQSMAPSSDTPVQEFTCTAIADIDRADSPVEDPKVILKNLQETFQNIIDDKIANIPLRLIDTHSGILYTSNDLEGIFKESEEYRRLYGNLLSTSVSKLQRKVDKFFRYAMLSHKWASAADEPQYWQIKGSLYEMDSPREISKLQQFCTTSKKEGYRWAWSDTCCIDKTNNAELQESVISMFSWYKDSAITIVYLADVSDISQLKDSQWFKRGWTLQELLAPQFIRFYKQDWQPLIDSDQNHKVELLSILHDITHIDIDVLKVFQPGVDNVKKRLSWVGNRTTKKIEDIAYCLMGIFGIHMPVMYGEKHNAFVRLQKEIMALTDDLSLFDWLGESSTLHSYFAAHPRCFMTPSYDARQDSTSSKFEFRLLKTSKCITSGLSSSARKLVKDVLSSPPHGRFIANGRMCMPFFVHEVVTLIPNQNKPGILSYLVKAEGLAELEVIVTQQLVSLYGKKLGVRYRIVRMWDARLVQRPSTDAEAPDALTVDKHDSPEPPTTEGSPKQNEDKKKDGDEEKDEEKGKDEDKAKDKRKDKEKRKDKDKEKETESWVGRSMEFVTDIADMVTQNTAVALIRKLQEPFVAQLLCSPGDKQPWRRVGTTTRVIAHASSGSINFRALENVIVH
ncbi:uncharacterized protein EDB93DRAFT_1131477 [Suillus bovinus]|uniref:uncharacterized protein n=1 Tax=Suillus bovinus TaxID=48563 RepID=UPI001B86ECD6|nr:uncharacterized protein EDB93DRAFT_1131477 [Suillus bovinus]KAG2155143.1 hypothetical protein EDB93DRAFT_1131477 [Suillus bovinus]